MVDPNVLTAVKEVVIVGTDCQWLENPVLSQKEVTHLELRMLIMSKECSEDGAAVGLGQPFSKTHCVVRN